MSLNVQFSNFHTADSAPHPVENSGYANAQMERQIGRVGSDRRFSTISRHISETVQDRDIVTIERQQELVCALSNGAIFSDLE